MEVPAHLRIRMAKRNLSHAYLVVGENRRPLAEALAAAWVCTGETPPCGHCPGCRKAGLGIHPDIIRADPEGEGLKAEEVRALRSDAYIRPNEAPKRTQSHEVGDFLAVPQARPTPGRLGSLNSTRAGPRPHFAKLSVQRAG